MNLYLAIFKAKPIKVKYYVVADDYSEAETLACGKAKDDFSNLSNDYLDELKLICKDDSLVIGGKNKEVA